MILVGSGMVAWFSTAARVATLPSCGKQQGDVAQKRMLQTHILIVLDVSEVCCKCFAWMLQKSIGMLDMFQWLYTHVARVCFKCFIYFSDVRCKRFIWILHMFHVYVASVLSGCCICLQRLLSVFRCFASVSDVCCKCFRRIL
jgi:hypothetical protein